MHYDWAAALVFVGVQIGMNVGGRFVAFRVPALQRMRAHVSGLSLPKKYDDSLCSLALHGPAGTGKTTLVEALAVTCDVPLVEVTPSDLVKRGEENIEQRARAVFEALSMLTRVVILFDEFDPVLKRRDAANNNPLSVFSFLTPGMLPKLKDLHSGAEKRSVAYVLVTNLIGEAVAAGRIKRKDEGSGNKFAEYVPYWA